MPKSALLFISTALSTACSNEFSDIPARTKQPCPVLLGAQGWLWIHTAGNECPILVKKLLSSGSVPLSEITTNVFISKQL